jgi:Zn-finger nucleic acid-binding protein
MNCPNCGAAMTLVAGRDYYRCDYCHSFHFPPGTGEDGVRVLDGVTGLDCPCCAKPLKNGRIENEPVQFCSRCRGFLATNPVFATIVRLRRAKRPTGESTYSFSPEEMKRPLICPKCERRMDTHPFFGGGRVIVDTCANCSLIWLDAGELAIIERHNLAPLVSPTPATLIPANDVDDWRIAAW